MPTLSARLIALFAALFVACLALPSVEAGGATALASPARVAPGAPLDLVFSLNTTAIVDATVAEQVTCTLTSPDGKASPCGSDGTLVDARVQPGGKSYVFRLLAPATNGNYTVTFARTSAVDARVLPDDTPATAKAVFEVFTARSDLVPSPGGPTPPTTTGGGSDIRPAGTPLGVLDSSGARWLATLPFFVAATVAGVSLTRRGGGAS